jgi:hypothetical protein
MVGLDSYRTAADDNRAFHGEMHTAFRAIRVASTRRISVENPKKSLTLSIAWIVLLVFGILMSIAGIGSLSEAYRGADPFLAGVTYDRLADLNPEIPNMLRGRRATAASLGVTCGMLLSWIAATAFRQREKWSWYALLSAFGLGSILSILRVPLLGYRAGAEIAAVFLVVIVITLAVSYRDFRH